MKAGFILAILFVMAMPHWGIGQNEEAIQLTQEAIQLMEKGEIDASIKLLEKAHSLDPNSHLYEYEIGYAHYLNKDYKKAIKAFQKALKYEDVTDQCYQVLGNVLDINGQRKEAIEIYEKGLDRFPQSGRLFFEMGNMQIVEKAYNEAIDLWEKGVVAEPTYPSNYYLLAKVFTQTDEPLWGLFYGELFMNLERNTERTEEISGILYDTYAEALKFDEKGGSVSLTKNTLVLDGQDPKNFQVPFSMAYELGLTLGVAEQGIAKAPFGPEAMIGIRTSLLRYWEEKNHFKKYPNILLDYHRKLEKAGHLDAYTRWILIKGSTDNFNAWYEKNEEAFNAFVAWFQANPIPLSGKDYFVRR